jgi:arylsulfatase A-like enzyme
MTDTPRRGRLARRAALVLGLVLAVGLLAPTSSQSLISVPAPPAVQERPNIVVIMADDMRQDDLRWMPRTRKLIAEHGAAFANSFAPYPLCCPARASFLSGQYTHNHGVWATPPPYGFASFDDDSTLPVWLQQAGYTTLFLGKYLNGYGRRPLPDGESSVQYVPPGWSDWRGAIDGGVEGDVPENGGTYRYWDMTLNVNGELEPHQGEYSTRVIGEQSVEMIDEYAAEPEPFFLWSSFVAPHHGRPNEPDDPHEVPRNDGRTTRIVTPAVPAGVRGHFDDQITKPVGLPTEVDVSDKPQFIRDLPEINKFERAAMLEAARQRAESLLVLDRQVYRMIEALRTSGELSETIVMFSSDNGYFQGEHRKRQGKTLPYEPSLRTPMLIRGPRIPHGVTRFTPFLSIDFAPTILRAAGARLRTSIDGQPRLGAAVTGGGVWQRPVLTETGPRPATSTPGKSFSTGVRTRYFLYVEHLSGEKELYDMRRDRGQLNSVAGTREYADEQRLMAKILRDLRRCVGAECRRPVSSW